MSTKITIKNVEELIDDFTFISKFVDTFLKSRCLYK